MAGFSQGGGVGLALANWMIEGDPGADIWAMDVARFGDWATRAYTNAKVRENYSRRFRIRFPNEELAAARPLRTTPIYDRLRGENAVFGDYYGLEHALWFAPKGTPAASRTPRFAAPTRMRTVGEECRAVRERVRPARDLELRQVRGHRPRRRGLAGAHHGLPRAGRRAHRAVADAQRARPADRRLHALPRRRRTLLRRRHVRRRGVLHALVRAAPAADRRQRASLRDGISGSVDRGPAIARSCCERSCDQDLSTAAFPFLSFAQHGRRHGAGARRARVVHRRARLRDLGHAGLPARALRPAWPAPARQLGLRTSAARALNSLRLEKSFGNWAREFRPIYGPYEAGLGRFVASRQARFHRPRGGGSPRRRAAANASSSRWPSMRRMPMRSGTSRSGTTSASSAGSRRAATATASASRSRSATSRTRSRTRRLASRSN